MRYMTMTYELAMAASWDVSNRLMRKAGRTAWSRANYNAGVREFNRLWHGCGNIGHAACSCEGRCEFAREG